MRVIGRNVRPDSSSGGRFLLGSLIAATVLTVSGCASPEKLTVVVDPGIVKLSEAADEIKESYKILSYAETARISKDGAANSEKYKLSEFPHTWQQVYVLEDDFYGELEPFLRGLSKVAGYNEPQFIGERPSLPVIVAIQRAKRPLADFLVDASYQSGGRASVTLDVRSNRLRITY